MRPYTMPFIVALLIACPAGAMDSGHTHVSPYAGEEFRDIKSLSTSDIEELRRGSGWGLAKSAELNGVPGPAHLLEMKDEIGLTGEQVVAIEGIERRMRSKAVEQGLRLIALERELDRGFREDTHTYAILRQSLMAVADARMELRYAHLAAHLETPKVLTDEQIALYNRLRGYSDASNPCDNVPKNHSAFLWNLHNDCR